MQIWGDTMSKVKNLCDILVKASSKETGIIWIQDNGSDRFLSYKDLYVKAKGVLYNIRKLGITRDNEVLMQIEDNESFITVFWACILGGMIPVPLHVGINKEQKRQLVNVLKVLKNPVLIAELKGYHEIKESLEIDKLDDFEKSVIEKAIRIEDIIQVTKSDDENYQPLPQDIAYIQFSSGSTGNPKGIMITHENIKSNAKAILSRVKCNKKDSVLNWLPITHSFSLVVGHISSMYAEINQYLMPTLLFLKNPILWMEKTHTYRNTMLLSPNFGFNHFLRFFNQEVSYPWDLSCIKIIAMGGEPIDVNLCNNFVSHMKQYGINSTILWPSYGMTESTVCITAPLLGDQLKAIQLERNSVTYGNKIKEVSSMDMNNTMSVVAVGYPIDECKVRICNDKQGVLEEKTIGSIQIKGECVTKGYYNNEDETKAVFTKDGWLKTGDTGFLFENQLVVTGREKDIIIINGQNYYPMDIERIVKEIKGLAFSEVAACGVLNKEKQKEEIILFILTKENLEAFAAQALSIKKYVNNCTGLEVNIIIPVEALPKASSGKIQRYKLAEKYLKGSFDYKIQALNQVSSVHSLEVKKPKNDIEERLVHIWCAALKMNRIGVDQSFFALGGDSLKAAFMLHQINKDFNMTLSLRDIFRHVTIEQLSEYINSVESGNYEDIQPVEEKAYYPLSAAQKRLYALYELDKNSISYNITQVVIAKGFLDIERVKNTFNTLIKRHEALRTSFKRHDGEIMQLINPSLEVNFSYEEADENKIDEIIDRFIMPYDFNHAPLFRIRLLKTSEKKHYILLDIHHIISDGVSMGILMKEFILLYHNQECPKPELNYKDYAVWQNENRDSEKINRQRKYWMNEFKDPIPLLNMPTDYRRSSKQQFDGDSVLFTINSEMTTRLKNLSKETSTTLYMVLMSTFNLLMHKYAKQEEVIVGTVSFGRNFNSLENVVGMFVNTLAIRSRITIDESFSDYLQSFKEKALTALENSDYQFDQLIDDLTIKRDLSRNPLFDVMFVMENMDIPFNADKSLQFSPYDYQPKGTKLDLTLKVQERAGEMVGLFQYNTSLFKKETIQRLVQYYFKLLNEITAFPEQKLSDIDMMPIEERDRLFNEFNATDVNYDRNLTIYEMFEKQVKHTPDKVAVVYKGEKLTYDELNKKANALAKMLRHKGVKQDAIVGLLVERSLHMVIGILAVMKAGGAYLPIDTDYPLDRIKYMLDNSNASTLMTHKNRKATIDFDGQILTIDDFNYDLKDTGNLESISKGKHMAYVIYTSGSTGKPKGVAIEHHSLVNYVTWFTSQAELSTKDKTLLLSSYAFDLSYTSLYSSLVCGCELHILSKEDYTDPEKLLTYISTYAITYIKATPSLLSMLVNTYSFSVSNKCQSIRLMVLGGEAIHVPFVEKYHNSYPATQIMNHYGPTECTIGCIATLIDLNHLDDYRACPVIGRPINNTKVYLLDDTMKPVTIGQTGELCIGGAGLTRGYLSLEDLNQERFIKSPLTSDANDRLYKTGDLGRYLEDGRIEFLGRKDNQVKVRGFRIELGEIDNSLSRYPDIEQSAVIDIEDEYGNKEIAVYFTSKEELQLHDLKKHLIQELPAYMIPSYYMKVNEIPITINGKVNRQALPIPNRADISDVEYKEPQSDIEIKLAKVWSEVLGIEKIGIDHDFFEIGGHSLKATVLISKIQKELNIILGMKDIFENPTIRELGQCMSQKHTEDFCSIKPADKRFYYPVSSSQKRLYTLAQMDKASISYNMPTVYVIEGDLDKNQLEDMLFTLFNRHEILRTTFHIMDGEVVQRIHNEVEVEVLFDDSTQDIEAIIKDFVKPFSLDTLPIFKIKLVTINPKRHVLLMDMHHIIFDGVSISLFINELNDLYTGKDLEPLRIQYKDYAIWQQALINSDEIKSQQEYWLNSFKEEWPKLTLPLDYKRPKVQCFEGDSIRFEIDGDMTQRLKKWNKETGTTLFMLLFGTYSLLLAKYASQEDIIVGTAEAGRHHEDVQSLIGLFINTLPIRTYPSGNKTLKQYFKEVREICFEVFNHSDYPLDRLLDKLQVKREMGRNPLFDTMFILENVEASQIKMNDLIFKAYEVKNTVSKFDLMLVGEEVKDKIKFEFKYCTKIFKYETVERLKVSYILILKEILKDYDKKICDINFISESEKKQLLYDFNQTSAYYEQEKTIAQLFEKQAVTVPERTAVVYKDLEISYRELNRRANCIAGLLSEKGVRKDSIVGIMVNRSIHMIVGILGILKAGGAYMPLSQDYPKKRIDYMIQDSQTKMVLTESELADNISYLHHAVCMDNEDLYTHYNNKEFPIKADSSDLAYVIYTSGTTGNPKGVMLENQSVVNLVQSLYDKVYKTYHYPLNVALVAPYIFDASVKQIFASLLLGHTLHIIPEEARVDGEKLLEYYIKNNIDLSDGTPLHLRFLSDCSREQLDRMKTKTFMIGGEALRNSVVTRFLSQFNQEHSPNIINVYGPTECCVDAALHVINQDNMNQDILIGGPLNNVKLYVLDPYQKMVPIGTQGELYISGDGVARGYLNQPELTKLKFIEDPLNQGKRLYKTGDYVKWTKQGCLKFIDRADNQVKIRGFRVELGEIESQLLKHSSIEEAVVVARKNEYDTKVLCAYMTCSTKMSINELRSYLSKELPDYMIPSYFIQLDKMPVTKNGKLDRKQLPALEAKLTQDEIKALPENEIQEILVKIWCEILGLQTVGINHNYFALGGDSIKAIQISAKLRDYHLGVEIRDLLQYQTIKELSSYVKYTIKEINQETVTGKIEITPIQKDFFNNDYADEHHFNQSVLLYSDNGLNEAFIEKIFTEMIQHHDALRMVFKKEDHAMTQFNRNDDKELFCYHRFDVQYEDDKGFIEKKGREIQSSIDVKNGPLVHLGLFRTRTGDYLLIVIHHLVVDGVSWRILLEDFTSAYQQLTKEQAIVLPNKTDSYKTWAKTLYQYAECEEIKGQLTYWRHIENQTIMPIPKDNITDGLRKIGDCKTLAVTLDKNYTDKLLKETHQAYNTEINDILLTALAKTIKRWMNNGQVLINLEGHGRENIADIDVSRTIGWFTSKYPVLFDIDGCYDLSSEIKNVKETLRHVPLKGIGYSILKYVTLPIVNKESSFKIEPEICFNYLGQFDHDKKNDLFLRTSIGTDDNISQNNSFNYVLSIGGMITQNKLKITVTYHTKEFLEETIYYLLESYRTYLKEIIDHCSMKQEQEYTPSDYDDDTLSLQELDVLNEMLKDIE